VVCNWLSYEIGRYSTLENTKKIHYKKMPAFIDLLSGVVTFPRALGAAERDSAWSGVRSRRSIPTSWLITCGASSVTIQPWNAFFAQFLKTIGNAEMHLYSLPFIAKVSYFANANSIYVASQFA